MIGIEKLSVHVAFRRAGEQATPASRGGGALTELEPFEVVTAVVVVVLSLVTDVSVVLPPVAPEPLDDDETDPCDDEPPDDDAPDEPPEDPDDPSTEDVDDPTPPLLDEAAPDVPEDSEA
jgi:hypothetical protein